MLPLKKCKIPLISLNSPQIYFDVKALTETCNIINLTNYGWTELNIEYCTTELSLGDTLLYIENHMLYKSILTELTSIKKSNVTFYGISRLLNMDLGDINSIYLNPVLDKTLKERKSIFILGYLKVDLLKYNHHPRSN